MDGWTDGLIAILIDGCTCIHACMHVVMCMYTVSTFCGAFISRSKLCIECTYLFPVSFIAKQHAPRFATKEADHTTSSDIPPPLPPKN